MIEDIKRLRREYIKFHFEGVKIPRMLFLCFLIDYSGIRFPRDCQTLLDRHSSVTDGFTA